MTPIPASPLLPEEARSALAGLRFQPRVLAEGGVSGIHLSSHPGQSLEFSELKGYAFGDDPKGIDWKVLARTDKLYVRRYQDETNLSAYLAIDASASMAAADGSSKYRHAASLIAGLAYVLLRQGDEVGLHVAHEKRPVVFPPRGVPSHLQEVLTALERVHPSSGTCIGGVLESILAQARKKGLVILASDLLTDWADVARTLGLLSARGHACIVLHVLSTEERTFPYRGSVLFRSLETGETALVDARGLRKQYLEAIERFVLDVRAACHDAGVFYYPVDMEIPPVVGVADVIRAVQGGRRRRVS